MISLEPLGRRRALEMLYIIGESSEDICMTDLVEMHGMPSRSTFVTLHELLDAGYVARGDGHTQHGTRPLVLTPAGEKVHRMVYALIGEEGE